MTEWITKDSGERQRFETGAQRDTQDGKARYELMPVLGLKRVAELSARGAEKYDAFNFRKGIPNSRVMASAARHIFAAMAGETDEDHLAAAAWNLLVMMENQERVARGALDSAMDDWDPKTGV